MLEKTKAIVLNKIKYTDSSIIVNLLSLKYGRTSIMVKACRNKKSDVKANIFFPLNIIETDIYYKQNRNIQLLKNAAPIYALNDISTDIYKTCIAQFLVEIIQKSIKEETQNTDVFNFIENAVIILEKSNKPINNFHVIFLIHLAKLLGFKITNNYCKQTPFFNIREGMFLPLFTNEEESLNGNESIYLSNLLNIKIEDFYITDVPYKKRIIILETLTRYYRQHILNDSEINSFAVLYEIFDK